MDEPGIWGAAEVVKGDPIKPGEGFHWTWLARGEHCTVNLVQARPGPELFHLHKDHDEVVYVVEADADFRLDDTVRPVKAGDVLFIPKGVPHGPVKGRKLTVLSIYGPAFDIENPDREYVDPDR